jgi:hypothetical protein
MPPHLQNEKDPLLRHLAPLHISRDYLYQASERASGRTTTTGAAHTNNDTLCTHLSLAGAPWNLTCAFTGAIDGCCTPCLHLHLEGSMLHPS